MVLVGHPVFILTYLVQLMYHQKIKAQLLLAFLRLSPLSFTGMNSMTPSSDNFLTDTLLDSLTFNDDGLIPAIAQQFDTGEVLMMAWMNRDSLIETLHSSRACYFSRSRQAFWRKGDSSGHIQTVKSCHIDCDGDTVLLLVDQTGAACHEGTRTCFTRLVSADGAVAVTGPALPERSTR
jgi:phosphoribosyl-AMP cyclohydrolase